MVVMLSTKKPANVNLRVLFGTTGRNRTGTELPQLDFESSASTSFATVA